MAQAAISPRVEASMWIAGALGVEAVVADVCVDDDDDGGGRRERLTLS